MTETLSTSRPPLSRALVEQVLATMLYTYGKKYTDQWGATDSKALAAFWGQQLAGYSDAEIKRGMAGLESRPFPPTLPEFKRLCRPPLDVQEAFYEALAGIVAREQGEVGEWSHPAIYWAAVKVGFFDIKGSGYAAIQKRWETALQAIFDAGAYDPIPAPALALPAPGKGHLDINEARQRLAALRVKIKIINGRE